LAEDQLPGSSVGELVQAIVVDQFERLRDGDSYWYENIFSGRSLRQIEETSLADIISRNTTIDNLQENVFFMQAELTGKVFVDSNGNRRQDRDEEGLKGITVELLDDEGEVIASTVTDRRGRYWFDEFRETGDYQVRVVAPDRYRMTTRSTEDVLISRGDVTVSGVDFGMRVSRNSDSGQKRDRDRDSRDQRSNDVDAAFSDNDSSDSRGDHDRSDGRRRR
jgi:hypothetical protein